jgi:hypothetical protein
MKVVKPTSTWLRQIFHDLGDNEEVLTYVVIPANLPYYIQGLYAHEY